MYILATCQRAQLRGREGAVQIAPGLSRLRDECYIYIYIYICMYIYI